MSKVVPEGWEKSILGKEIRLIKGSLVKDLYDQKKEGMIPYLLIESFNSGQSRYVYPTGMSLCKEEDPVLVMDGSRSGLVLRGKSGVIGSTLASILPSEPSRLDKGYLFYILDSLYKLLNKSKTSGAVPHVDRTLLLNIPIFLPPPPEQQKISTILSSVDTAIEKTKTVIEQTKIVKKGLMQGLFTKGIPGRHKKFKKTPIGKVPEEWKIVQLGEICTKDTKRSGIQTGPFGSQLTSRDFAESGIPILNIGNIQDCYLNVSKLDFIKTTSFNKLSKYTIQEGDLLFSRMATVGRTCVVPKSSEGWIISYHLIRVSLDKALTYPYFIMLQLSQSKRVLSQIEGTATGGTRAGINSEILSKLIIVLPDLKEQKSIASVFLNLNLKIKTNENIINQLNILKSALMQILLTGEVRIKI